MSHLQIFLWAMLQLGNRADCKMPTIVYEGAEYCQTFAKVGWVAEACYAQEINVIYMSRKDDKLEEYEMLRAVTQSCLHKEFNPTNRDWRDVLTEYEDVR